jgi:hypothetical protein
MLCGPTSLNPSSDHARAQGADSGIHELPYTSPRPLPRVFPPSLNPRWRASGYSARFPEYGFDPKWQAFGYNPKYSGFQPRPSVLRPFRLSASDDVHPPNAEPIDPGGSTIYQTAGDAQISAQIGLPAQQANRAQYPSSGGPPSPMTAVRPCTRQRATHRSPPSPVRQR